MLYWSPGTALFPDIAPISPKTPCEAFDTNGNEKSLAGAILARLWLSAVRTGLKPATFPTQGRDILTRLSYRK